MASFGNKSNGRLDTCDIKLQLLFREVVKIINCTILDGHRGKERQEEAFEDGVSKVHWPNSRHNTRPSKAVDVMPFYQEKPHIHWDMDNKQYYGEMMMFAGIVFGVAAKMGIKVKWGGQFKSFFDGPHWELED